MIQSSIEKSTAFTITFDDNKSENLQEAFLKFKKYKEDGIELAHKNRLLSRKMRNNPERMWELRMKFVEQCKKYFGVPYAKKYFSPDSPEYRSSIFLDCCGLIRRAMRDLEKDFGFRIGGGNQAYMFDTLPKIIHDLSDVKPGDLVFISGIYYNEKMKKQRHNMTHVEVMLGEGEKTIGARWNNGKVQVFNSYRFEASSFHSPTYYFKSIDTWLLGICRSFCPKHTWPYKIYRPNRKSIFAVHNGNNTVVKKKKKKKSKKSSKSGKTSSLKKKKIKKKSSLASLASSVAATEIQQQNELISKSSLEIQRITNCESTITNGTSVCTLHVEHDDDIIELCDDDGTTPNFQLGDDYEEDEDDDFEEEDDDEFYDEDADDFYDDDEDQCAAADELIDDVNTNEITARLSVLNV